MNRYESKTPRAVFALAAIALTAATMGATVLWPAHSEAARAIGFGSAAVVTAAASATATQCINGIVAARS
jgi:hypothetical protein